MRLINHLIIVLVLTFSLQSLTKADDIRDFEIEEMSIGDSLLDYFSKSEIKNFFNYDDLPSDMKFRIAEFYSEKDYQMEVYEIMQVYYKPEDKKFIIFGLNGNLYCKSDSWCNKKYENIIEDVSKNFSNSNDAIRDEIKHPDDKSGKSLVKIWRLELQNGYILIRNTNWSEEVSYTDNVSVEFSTYEVNKWVSNNFGIGWN